jgi:hypothetical protein
MIFVIYAFKMPRLHSQENMAAFDKWALRVYPLNFSFSIFVSDGKYYQLDQPQIELFLYIILHQHSFHNRAPRQAC